MLAKTGIHCNSFNTILRWGSSRVLSHYIRTHSDVPEILYDKGNGCILGNSRYNLKFTVLETIHPRCVMDKAVNPNTATVYSSANSTTCFGLIGHHQVDQECNILGQPDDGLSGWNMLFINTGRNNCCLWQDSLCFWLKLKIETGCW